MYYYDKKAAFMRYAFSKALSCGLVRAVMLESLNCGIASLSAFTTITTSCVKTGTERGMRACQADLASLKVADQRQTCAEPVVHARCF